MVKINEEGSPTKKIPDSSENASPPSTALRFVTISSPLRESPRKRTASTAERNAPNQASPVKREFNRTLGSNSPYKGSPHKRMLDLKTELSPSKKTALTSLTSPNKSSPRKQLDGANKTASPHKRVLQLETDNSREEKSLTKIKSPRKRGEDARESRRETKPEATLSSSIMSGPLAEAQSLLRERISQTSRPPSICGYDQERKQLRDLIRRTALTGESNSMLLIGPRGCGKSMLLRDVVEDLYKEVRIQKDMMLVQLNGLLQSDDRIALREITRQLKLENTVGDRVFGSFAETLQFLLEALKKGDQGSKSTLFVLEEFDLFAQHRNQTLLYNLFDISQSAQAPICVVGVTCRLDVVELLEKRVKSRFSHRQLHLFNKLTLGQYRSLCRDYLSLPETFSDGTFHQEWNQNVQTLLDEVSVKDVLERQFNMMNDVRGLQTLLTYPICKISRDHPSIQASDIITSFKLMSTDTKSSMLHGVSILELSIIIAMKHLTDIYEGEPFNFEMVYSEYLKFARHRTGMQVYEKAIVMKAYEHLQTLELVRNLGGAGSGGQKEYKLMTLLVHPAQIMDALQKYPSCPTEIKQWASQSIS